VQLPQPQQQLYKHVFTAIASPYFLPSEAALLQSPSLPSLTIMPAREPHLSSCFTAKGNDRWLECTYPLPLAQAPARASYVSNSRFVSFSYVLEFDVHWGIFLLCWDKLALPEISIIFAILVCFPACKSSLLISCSSMLPIILLLFLFL